MAGDFETIELKEVPPSSKHQLRSPLVIALYRLAPNMAIKKEFPTLRAATNKRKSTLSTLHRHELNLPFRVRSRVITEDGKFYLYLWKVNLTPRGEV